MSALPSSAATLATSPIRPPRIPAAAVSAPAGGLTPGAAPGLALAPGVPASSGSSTGKSRRSDGGGGGPLASLPGEVDVPSPSASLLHSEPLAGPPLRVSTKRLFHSARGTGPVGGVEPGGVGGRMWRKAEDHSSSSSSSEEEEEMPSGFLAALQTNTLSSSTAQGALGGGAMSAMLARQFAKHAASTNAANASSSSGGVGGGGGGGGGGVGGGKVKSPEEQTRERAERMWQQQRKWKKVLRRAATYEEPEAPLSKENHGGATATSNNNNTAASNNSNNNLSASSSSSAGSSSSSGGVHPPARRIGFLAYCAAYPSQVRRLISRGIPGAFRGFVWQQLSGSADPAWRRTMMGAQFQINQAGQTGTHANSGGQGERAFASSSSSSSLDSRPGLSDLSPSGAYHRILRELGRSALPTEDQIIKDLHRTFPRQAFFQDRSGGTGQSSLFHVLKAYACFDPELGYCQGMGYIAAGLLQHVDEEEAFWLLVCLLHHPRYGGLRGLFLESMPKLNAIFFLLDQILAKDLPKLAAHLEQTSMHLSMFASTWFMTLYAGAFVDFENVARIWDVFLWQGLWFVVKVAVGILRQAERHLVGCSFEHCLSYLKYIQSSITPDQLIEQSLLVTLDYAECARWELEFDREQKAQQAERQPPPPPQQHQQQQQTFGQSNAVSSMGALTKDFAQFHADYEAESQEAED